MYKTLWLMVIKVGEKWCQATKTWKFWWNFLAKSLFLSRYPSFSPFERPDAYKCYTFSESCGSRETREIKISTSKFDLEARGILSSLWTQTGPWSDPASYMRYALISMRDYPPDIERERIFITMMNHWLWKVKVHYRDQSKTIPIFKKIDFDS